jgi:hypothetical protein
LQVFLGIPYASPPIRFSPTQTPIPWEGIKDTDKPGSVCPQVSSLYRTYYIINNNISLLPFNSMNADTRYAASFSSDENED